MSDPSFLLIDYASLHLDDLAACSGQDWLIKIFVGASEHDLEIAKVSPLQKFGAGLEYIQIDGDGPAVVASHIAFYLGKLAAANPRSTFRIVAKGGGLDPLLRHLAGQGIDCQLVQGEQRGAGKRWRDGKFH
jgi:hypothetical protein